MKVAVSAYGDTLDAEVNPRFGRCDYLLIVDTKDMSFESFSNENMNRRGGAGIQTASFVISKGIAAVLTGSVGPNAMDVFTSNNIDVYTGQKGTVTQAIQRFNLGGLSTTTEATAPEKAGVNPALNSPGNGSGMQPASGMGGGRGRGMAGGGRGMGGGGGRGMGGGSGMGRRR